jgi:predicted DNA-binding transcriptional regulator
VSKKVPARPLFSRQAEDKRAEAIALKFDVSRRWGFDRLLKCITKELLARWIKQEHLMNSIMSTTSYEKMYEISMAYIRGLKAIEQNAIDRGFKELPKDVWQVDCPVDEFEDWKIFVALSENGLPAACAMSHNEPKTLYYSVRELIVMNEEAFRAKVKMLEAGFGQTQIVEMKPTTQKDIDGCTPHDEII